MATKGGAKARSFLRAFQSEMGRFNEMQEYDRRSQQGAEQYMRRMAQQNAYSDYKSDQEQKFRQKLEQIRADNEMIKAEYEHDLRMDEIAARNEGDLAEASVRASNNALAEEKFRLDQYKAEDARYDTEIRELDDRYRQLARGSGLSGIVSKADKIEMQRIQDQIKQKQLDRRRTWYNYKGIEMPDETPSNVKTMSEWREMNSDLGAMDLPVSVKNNIATKRAQRYGYNILGGNKVAGKKIKNTGTDPVSGRKVVMYEDGTIDYAD